MAKPSSDGFPARLHLVLKEFTNVKTFLEVCAENGTRISETGFRSYLKGSEPSRANLVAMAKAAKVDLNWFATGDGQPWPDDDESAKDTSGCSLTVRLPQSRPSLRPAIKCLALDKSYASENFSEPENLELVFLDSDVMEPRIVRGSVLLVDKSSTKLTEGVFFIAIEGAETCRRLVYSDEGTVWHADNEAYPPIDVSPDATFVNVKVLGRVVSVIRMSRV